MVCCLFFLLLGFVMFVIVVVASGVERYVFVLSVFVCCLCSLLLLFVALVFDVSCDCCLFVWYMLWSVCFVTCA